MLLRHHAVNVNCALVTKTTRLSCDNRVLKKALSFPILCLLDFAYSSSQSTSISQCSKLRHRKCIRWQVEGYRYHPLPFISFQHTNDEQQTYVNESLYQSHLIWEKYRDMQFGKVLLKFCAMLQVVIIQVIKNWCWTWIQ